MTTRLFFNYYRPHCPKRRAEIATCLEMAATTPGIDEIVLLLEPMTPVPLAATEIERVESRPSFASIFQAIDRRAGADDVSIIINSDCFLHPRDIARCRPPANEAYCIRRRDIISARPLRLDRRRNRAETRRFEHDMQDCWVIRGGPRGGMWLDYPMGLPGCDNRLAFELKRAGYRIRDPYHNVRLYHFHRAAQRGYSEADRVPLPYAYPEKIPPASRLKRMAIFADYKARMLEVRLRLYAREARWLARRVFSRPAGREDLEETISDSAPGAMPTSGR